MVGARALTANGPNSKAEFPAYLEGAGSQGLHHSTERLWAHLGSNSDTWRGVIGRNALSDLNLSSILLLDFWARSHVVVMPYVVWPYVLDTRDGLR